MFLLHRGRAPQWSYQHVQLFLHNISGFVYLRIQSPSSFVFLVINYVYRNAWRKFIIKLVSNWVKKGKGINLWFICVQWKQNKKDQHLIRSEWNWSQHSTFKFLIFFSFYVVWKWGKLKWGFSPRFGFVYFLQHNENCNRGRQKDFGNNLM